MIVGKSADQLPRHRFERWMVGICTSEHVDRAYPTAGIRFFVDLNGATFPIHFLHEVDGTTVKKKTGNLLHKNKVCIGEKLLWRMMDDNVEGTSIHDHTRLVMDELEQSQGAL